MIRNKCILLIALTVLVIKADFSPAYWEYKKQIEVNDIEGVSRVKVDAEIYNHSKLDLSDVRIINYEGEETPYRIETHESKKGTVCFEPKLYNISHKPDAYTEFYLAMDEENQIINKLHIVTSDRNFRRKVEIWGSDDGVDWLKIRDDANIFSFYTEDHITALTDIKFPDTKRKFFKIVIWNKGEKPLVIERCWLYEERISEAPPNDITFKIISRSDNYEKKRTEIILDVVYKNIPKKEINLKLDSDQYYRNVWVFGSDDAENWQRINSGVIYRYNKENKNNIINLMESRSRYLKLLIYNQDDPPLKIEYISIKGEQQFIYFPVKKNEKYSLFYGNSDARKPIYEFEKLFPFMESEKRFMVDLDKEELNKDFSRIKEAIKENEIVFMWPIVAFVVISLGFLIVKSLKGINEKREKKRKRKKGKKNQ